MAVQISFLANKILRTILVLKNANVLYYFIKFTQIILVCTFINYCCNFYSKMCNVFKKTENILYKKCFKILGNLLKSYAKIIML